ncbi:hypothetical protein ABPG74_005149 [Tetrahymena malaccensis]
MTKFAKKLLAVICLYLSLTNCTPLSLFVNVENNYEYKFMTLGVLGGLQTKSFENCSQGFLINLGLDCISDPIKDINTLIDCGGSPLIYGKYSFTQYLSFGSYNMPINYAFGSTKIPKLSFCSIDYYSIPAAMVTYNLASNDSFYVNFVNDFKLEQGASTQSSISIGEPHPNVIESNQESIIMRQDQGQSNWILPLESISIIGNTVSLQYSGSFFMFSQDSLGLGVAFPVFLKQLYNIGIYYQHDDKLNIYSIDKSDFSKLPDIIFTVNDINGDSHNLVIPPINYVQNIDGRYILKLNGSNSVGYPFFYTYYTRFSNTDKTISIAKKGKTEMQNTFLRKSQVD